MRQERCSAWGNVPAHGCCVTADWAGRGFKLRAVETRALPRSLHPSMRSLTSLTEGFQQPAGASTPCRDSGRLRYTRRSEDVFIEKK
ncbi:uncharacterized [Tachysurus ichikawai]